MRVRSRSPSNQDVRSVRDLICHESIGLTPAPFLYSSDFLAAYGMRYIAVEPSVAKPKPQPCMLSIIDCQMRRVLSSGAHLRLEPGCCPESSLWQHCAKPCSPTTPTAAADPGRRALSGGQ